MSLPISAQRFRDMASYSLKLFLENWGQTAANGDMVTTCILTAYRKSPAPYDLPFSHNTALLVYYSAL